MLDLLKKIVLTPKTHALSEADCVSGAIVTNMPDWDAARLTQFDRKPPRHSGTGFRFSTSCFEIEKKVSD